MDPGDILDVTVNRKIPVPAGNPLQSCSSEPAATMTELMCEYSTLGKMGTVTSTVETRNNNYMKAQKKKKSLIQGCTNPGCLNFVWWYLRFVGPQNGNFFTSPLQGS